MNDQQKDKILKDIIENRFAKNALRTIATAYTDLSYEEYQKLKEENNEFDSEEKRQLLEKNMIFVCIFAIGDPLRPEVADSIRVCN